MPATNCQNLCYKQQSFLGKLELRQAVIDRKQPHMNVIMYAHSNQSRLIVSALWLCGLMAQYNRFADSECKSHQLFFR